MDASGNRRATRGRRDDGDDLAHDLVEALFLSDRAAMAVLDADLRFVRVNARFAELTGVAPELHAGRTPMDVVPTADPSQYVDVLQRALGGEATAALRFDRVPGQAGDAVWEARVVPLVVGGTVSGVGVVVVDVQQLDAAQASVRRAESERMAAEHARQRLEVLESVSGASLARLSMPELLDNLLGQVTAALGTEIATVLLMDEADGTVVAAASVGLDDEVGAAQPIPLGAGVAGRVAASGEPLVITDLAGNEVVSDILRSHGVRSIASVPLLVGQTVIGVLQTASLERAHFRSDDVELLRSVAARAAIAVDRAQLFERQRAIADTLQRSLLPAALPSVPDVDLAARYRPGSEETSVGGDWYDVIDCGDGSVLLIIGDVMGHGIEAAAVMGRLRNAFGVHARMTDDLAAVLAGVNATIADVTETHIATVLVAHFDRRRGELCWVSAGHPPLVVRHPDGDVEIIPGHIGPPLGVAVGWTYATNVRPLEPGSTVVLYTDGLIERRDRALEDQVTKLERAIAAAPDDAAGLCDALIASLVDDQARDDIAVLAMQLSVTATRPLQLVVEAGPDSLRACRRDLRDWLVTAHASADEAEELVLAVTEALNDRLSRHDMHEATVIEAHVEAETVHVTVDGYQPSAPQGTDQGRRLVVMEHLVDELTINKTARPPAIHLTRRLHHGESSVA